MVAANGVRVRVLDTIKSGETHLIVSWSRKGTLGSVSSVMRMLRIRANRDCEASLGDNICFRSTAEGADTRQSRGSLVDDELRFDSTLKRSLMKNSVRLSSVLMRKSCVTRKSSPGDDNRGGARRGSSIIRRKVLAECTSVDDGRRFLDRAVRGNACPANG